MTSKGINLKNVTREAAEEENQLERDVSQVDDDTKTKNKRFVFPISESDLLKNMTEYNAHTDELF